jgi:hypothetical protein
MAMTHDELLAKIDNALPMFDANNPVLWSAYKEYLNALRAVVELHQPNEYTDWVTVYEDKFTRAQVGTPYTSELCSQCAEDFPCPTIQAIEKELG